MAHQLANLSRSGRGHARRSAGSLGQTTSHVTVNVGEVLPLLADAVASQRTWLSDFENDEITISADLYEVLLAYQYYPPPGGLKRATACRGRRCKLHDSRFVLAHCGSPRRANFLRGVAS